MSTQDPTSQQDDAMRGGFPRIELPPVPPLGRTPHADAAPVAQPSIAAPTAPPAMPAPATSLDGRPVGGQDEAPGDWQYPYGSTVAEAAPARTGYTFQVVPPPVPVTPAAPAPIATPAPAQAPYVMPELATVPARDVASDAADDADTGPSTAVLVIFAILTLALLWASRMAFSAGLLAFASLLMAELALATSFAHRAGASRPASSKLLAIGAVIIALNAARHAIAQFGEMAFVAGLFVLVAGVPTLLLLGVSALLLRRSKASSRANDALRSWTTIRFVALGALLAAGVQAHRTFSAKPDAIVALGIVALALVTAAAVLRGTGRAALARS